MPIAMKRPWSVTLIGILFILSGGIGIIYHAPEMKELPGNRQGILVLLIRALAVAGGYFVLRGAAWARWLLVVWMIYHVVLSFYHDLAQIITHALFLCLVVAGLFYSKANTYFKQTK